MAGDFLRIWCFCVGQGQMNIVEVIDGTDKDKKYSEATQKAKFLFDCGGSKDELDAFGV